MDVSKTLSDPDRAMAVGLSEWEQMEAAFVAIPPETAALLRIVFLRGFGCGIDFGARFGADEASRLFRECGGK